MNSVSAQMMFKNILCLIIAPWCLLAQTKVESLNPEINSSFALRFLGKKANVSASISQRFFTTDETQYFTGLTQDAYTSSNLVYSRMALSALKKFNKHWFGTANLQTQLGRYHFYNYNRSFSTIGASLGHKGKIDEITFYKELGATTNNQKPKSIKDLYFNVKFEYVIKSNQKNIAIASLSGKIDWLGTSFKSADNDIFVLRSKDESFLKKVDQSFLILNFDFLLSPKNTISLNTCYFTEYYPSADQGYDKRNVKHYIFGIVWGYQFFRESLDVVNHMY